MVDFVNRHFWLFRASVALYLQIWRDFTFHFTFHFMLLQTPDFVILSTRFIYVYLVVAESKALPMHD